MRVLRAIASVNPRSGGPIEALARSATTMAELGYETEVLSLDPPEATWVKAFPFPIHATGPVALRPYGYTSRMVRWLRDHRSEYDAVIVEGLWNYASFGTWRALAGSDTPYVVFTHGMLDPWFRDAYPLKHHMKQLYWLLAEGKVLRDAALVLFTTEEERQLARGVFRGYGYNEHVVAFGTADPPPPAPSQTEAWRELVPALRGRRFLLYLSRIHPKKGCDLLIDAFGRLAPEYPDLDLVIAGPDQTGWSGALRARAEGCGVGGRIHWPGMVAGDAKWGAFRAAEAFVLPSHQENFGIVIAEAMACRRPVLITDKVNIWREVEASGGGIICSDTVADVEQQLRRFLSLSSAEKAEMGERARAGFLERFEIKQAALDLSAALQQATSKAPKAKGLVQHV